MFSSFQAPRSWGRPVIGELDANGDVVPVYPSYTQFGLDFSNTASYPGTGTTVYSLDGDGSAVQTGDLGTVTVETVDGFKAAKFDGTNSISFPAFEFTGQVSFNYWVKLSTKDNIHTLFSNAGAGLNSDGFKVCVNGWTTNNGNINMEIGNGTDPSLVKTVDLDIVPRDGTAWAMCTYALSFVDSVTRFWVNGVEYATTGTSVPDPKTNGPWWVGEMSGSTYGMIGYLAEMTFWGGLVNNSEVQTIWNATKAKYGY